MKLYLSMAAFALAASISPGPVNIVALRSGTQYGFRASLAHVSGATIGFTVLLLLTGLGLHELLNVIPALTQVIQWAGVAFLLFLAYKLAVDDGQLQVDEQSKGPSAWYGALMQWLNPKAWLASIAGMGAYAANGDISMVWHFTIIYFFICYASIAAWAYAGTALRQLFRRPALMRAFNRSLAVMLLISAVYLMLT
ncbi:LysE family translocator [Undibacterium sp. Ji50W]|uniref:LysE family translocator n=1 Tax=Undibacterium sp. Ji50W TaxID=3413041 RepID=UPI003BF05C8F